MVASSHVFKVMFRRANLPSKPAVEMGPKCRPSCMPRQEGEKVTLYWTEHSPSSWAGVVLEKSESSQEATLASEKGTSSVSDGCSDDARLAIAQRPAKEEPPRLRLIVASKTPICPETRVQRNQGGANFPNPTKTRFYEDIVARSKMQIFPRNTKVGFFAVHSQLVLHTVEMGKLVYGHQQTFQTSSRYGYSAYRGNVERREISDATKLPVPFWGLRLHRLQAKTTAVNRVTTLLPLPVASLPHSHIRCNGDAEQGRILQFRYSHHGHLLFRQPPRHSCCCFHILWM